MARPKVRGMDYFPHDTNALNDEKIEVMVSNFGTHGYAFYFILCERIYRSDNYELDISKPEIVKVLEKKTVSDAETFQKLLKMCLEIGLFDSQDYANRGVLTSNGIKKRAKMVEEKRENSRKSYQNRVSVAETPPETTPETTQSKGKESKVKESKVKESKDIYTPPDKFQSISRVTPAKYNLREIPVSLNTPEFVEVWEKFINHRKEIRKPITPLASKQQLKKLSNNSVGMAILMIEESIANGWQGIFPIKDKNETNKRNTSKRSGISDYTKDKPGITIS